MLGNHYPEPWRERDRDEEQEATERLGVTPAVAQDITRATWRLRCLVLAEAVAHRQDRANSQLAVHGKGPRARGRQPFRRC